MTCMREWTISDFLIEELMFKMFVFPVELYFTRDIVHRFMIYNTSTWQSHLCLSFRPTNNFDIRTKPNLTYCHFLYSRWRVKINPHGIYTEAWSISSNLPKQQTNTLLWHSQVPRLITWQKIELLQKYPKNKNYSQP